MIKTYDYHSIHTHNRLGGVLTMDDNIAVVVSSAPVPQWITVQGVKTVKVQFRDTSGILHANASCAIGFN